jgi:tetratricopeptide (TPR) repeat protein
MHRNLPAPQLTAAMHRNLPAPQLTAAMHRNLLAPPMTAVMDRTKGSEVTRDKPTQTMNKISESTLVETGAELFSKGLVDEAEVDFKKAIQLNGQDPDALFNLGAIAESRANLNEAENFYQRALLAKPNDKEIMLALASIESKNKTIPASNAVNAPNAHKVTAESAFERPIPDPSNPYYVPGDPVPGLHEVPPKTAEVANSRAIFRHTTALSDWLLQSHRDFTEILRKTDSGLYELVDHSKQWIDEIDDRNTESLSGIPATKIEALSLEALPPPAVCRVLALRCLELVDQRFDSAIRNYVTKGGFLVIDHTSLEQIPEIFPGTIELSHEWHKPGAGGSRWYDNVIDAHLEKPDPVLAFGLVTNAVWHVPSYSPIIQVIDRDNVRVLCVSDTLAKAAPETRGALAAIFSWGRGYVYCFSGLLENTEGQSYSFASRPYFCRGTHVVDRDSELRIALREGLLANFIYAGLTGKRIPELKRDVINGVFDE